MRSLLSWGRKQKLTVIGPKQHLTAPEAVTHWLKKDATVRARLYRKKGTKWLHVDDMSLIDLAQIIQEMENSLRDAYGGGQYQLKLVDASGHLLGQYEYPIAGPIRYQDEDGGASRGRSTKLEEMVLELLKAKFLEDPAKGLVAQLTALKAIQGDNAFGNEFMSVMANNFITEKDNMLDNVAKVLELSKSMVPVSQDDPLMALAAGALPVLGQLMMNRNAPAGAAGVTQTQQALSQVEAVPPPSAAQADQGAAEEEHEAAERRLVQLRHEITAGAEPQKVADRILLLVRAEAYDCAFDARDPHPALAGMVTERDPMKLSEAYDSFCEAVPELASNPQLASRIGAALAARVVQQVGAAQSEEAEPAMEEAEPAMEEAEPGTEAGASDDTDHATGDRELQDAETVDVSGGDREAGADAGEGGPTGEASGRIE